MAAKYKIIFKDGRDTRNNLSFEDALQFKIDNIADDQFEIIEITAKPKKANREKKVKDDGENEQTKKQFIETLTPIQRQNIEAGSRRVKYSKEIGYYLQVIHKDSTFFSQHMEETKEETIIRLKKSINKAETDDEIWNACYKLITYLVPKTEYIEL